MNFIDHKPYALATLCGTLSVAIAAVLNILAISPADFYLMAAGAVIIVAEAFIFAWKNRTSDIRLGRLHRINFLSSLTLIIAAYMMFVHSNSWVAMIILYAALQIFLAIRWKE